MTRRPRAFTLVELLMAIVVSTLLMAAVLTSLAAVSRDHRRLAAATAEHAERADALLARLRWDLANGSTMSQDADGRTLVLVGHGALDRRTLQPSGRLARVTYRCVGDATAALNAPAPVSAAGSAAAPAAASASPAASTSASPSATSASPSASPAASASTSASPSPSANATRAGTGGADLPRLVREQEFLDDPARPERWSEIVAWNVTLISATPATAELPPTDGLAVPVPPRCRVRVEFLSSAAEEEMWIK